MRIFGLNRRIIQALLGSQYAYMLEYRAEIALWALSGVLPFIMLSVWSGSAARTGLGLCLLYTSPSPRDGLLWRLAGCG